MSLLYLRKGSVSLSFAKKSVCPNGSAFKQSLRLVEVADAEELDAVGETEAEFVPEAVGAEELGWEADDAPVG